MEKAGKDLKVWGLVYYPSLKFWDLVTMEYKDITGGRYPVQYKGLTREEAVALIKLLAGE